MPRQCTEQKRKEFFADFEKYPYQAGSSLSAADTSDETVRMAKAMKRLNHLEGLALPDN